MLNQNTLEAVKDLARLALSREQEIRLYGAPHGNSKHSKFISDLFLNAPSDLMEAVQLHRLAIFLAGDSLIEKLFCDLNLPLKEIARNETLAALALTGLTHEISALFEMNGIPMMVLKGIPLSLQTTQTVTARGRGDLDLWVRPRDLSAAINLLESVGFRLTRGFSCFADSTFQGLYSRFVSIEISLMRIRGQHIQFIDLHWDPSHIRGVLPSFKTIWEQRDYVSVNGQKIATLPIKLAFVHSCCHANHDYWRSLRQLVDVIRLGMLLPSHDILDLSKCRPVSKTCCVAAELTEESVFNLISARVPLPRTVFARKEARRAQLFVSKDSEGKKWIFSRIRSALRVLNCHHHFAHFFSHLFFNFVTPAALMNSKTGRYRSLLEIILYRWNLFRRYMSNSEE
jgi:hypothetical protein